MFFLEIERFFFFGSYIHIYTHTYTHPCTIYGAAAVDCEQSGFHLINIFPSIHLNKPGRLFGVERVGGRKAIFLYINNTNFNSTRRVSALAHMYLTMYIEKKLP